MILTIARSYIGSFGRTLMDTYIANSFFINMVILLYALIVYVAQRNYLFVLHKFFTHLNLIKELDEKNILLRKINKSDYKNFSWTQLRKRVWFPLIAAPGKWTFRICTTKYLEEEFTVKKINSYIDQNKEER